MRRSTLKTLLFSGFVVGGCGILGGFLGDGALADGRKAADRLHTFGQVLSLVEDQYVGEVDSDELLESAIQGMLRRLDPHSNYLSADAFDDMRDEQRGKFSGLGIQITKRGADKPLTIIAPIDDTPADRAGLQAGDIISKIEGVDTLEMTVQEAVTKLKGIRGTPVTITVQRPGDHSEFDVTIVRDDIDIKSIRLAFMVRPDVGYISIANFTSTTGDELDAALRDLESQGMTKLVLDLRDNPGGLLEQAVEVSERFLGEGKLIVTTKGRTPGSDQSFASGDSDDPSDVDLVVLVNRGSASASEIVSGAIQDHDRGLVVGETTFGKGLVQRVVPLRNGGALAVTIAKYYTPSGRLIQRDYSDLQEYFANRPEDEALAEDELPDELEDAGSDLFYTASGRKVFGGGGIAPDHEVEAQSMPTLLTRMLRDNHIFEFAVGYAAEHRDLQPGFAGGEPLVSEFRGFLDERAFEYEADTFAEHAALIELRVRAQISQVLWNRVEESRILSQADEQLQRALELFDEARELSEAGRAGTPRAAHAGATPDPHAHAGNTEAAPAH